MHTSTPCTPLAGAGTPPPSPPAATADAIFSQGSKHLQRAEFASAQSAFVQALVLYEKAWGIANPQLAYCLNGLGAVLHQRGKFDSANQHFARAVKLVETASASGSSIVGPSDSEVAGILCNWASVLADQGKFAKARPLYERALKIREKAVGPDHVDVAACLSYMGELLRRERRLQEARPLIERALKIRETVHDAVHQDVAESLNNLGLVVKDLGELELARSHFERALTIVEVVCGLDHPHTAAGLNNLALVLKQKGDVSGALPLYQRAKVIYEACHGPNHPNVSNVLVNIAQCLQEMPGQRKNASELVDRARGINQALRPSHPESVVAQSIATGLHARQLCCVCHAENQGKLLKCGRCQNEFYCSATCQKADWKRHKQVCLRAESAPAEPASLWITGQLMRLHGLQTQPDLNNQSAIIVNWDAEAERYLVEVAGRRRLKVRADNLEPRVLDTSTPEARVAIDAYDAGKKLIDVAQFTLAQPLLAEALPLLEAAFGSVNDTVAACLNDLARCLTGGGRLQEATAMHRRALSIGESLHGVGHLATGTSLSNLSHSLWNEGKYAEALPCAQQTLAIFERFYDATHPTVCNALNQVATILVRLGQFALALPLHQRILTAKEAQHGQGAHPEVGAAKNNLAKAYHELGDSASARAIWQRALDLNISVHGTNYPDSAYILDGLGLLLCDEGKFAEAVPLLEKAVELAEMKYGPAHPYVASHLLSLTEALENLPEHFKRARDVSKRAKRINQHSRPEHSETSASQEMVARLREQQVCRTCATHTTTMQKCSQCSNEWYCSVGCQQLDWKRHKTECKTAAKHET